MLSSMYKQSYGSNRSLIIASSYTPGYISNRSLNIALCDNQDNNPKGVDLGAFDPVSIGRKTHLTSRAGLD